MKKVIIASAVLLLGITSLHAQLRERDNLLGPSIGFWPSGSAPTFGLNYENQLTQAGPGTISLGGVFRYTTWRSDITPTDYWSINYYTFGLQSNYNFNEVGEGKFVPFVGLVLGYNAVNESYTSSYGYTYNYTGTSSGLWLWLQGGMRYFFSPKVAGTLRLGLGSFNYNTIEIGVDFKL
jgi:hypothetical protein